MRRVVVTGLGMISPVGPSVAVSWDNVLRSKSGIKRIPHSLFDTSDLATKIAGFIPDSDAEFGFNLGDYLSSKEARKMDRFIHFAIVASTQAIEDSGWTADSEEKATRAGVMIGSGIGGLMTIEETASILKENGAKKVSPFFIPASLINLASGHVSIKYNLKGPVHSVVTACATGSHAIGDSYNLIRAGYADMMVAGGAEAPICRLGIAGFNACKALSIAYNELPETASRPWDEGRDGFVMGEGSGIIVLEEYESAKKRGAKIYAEVIGYGLSGDAYHITAPSMDGDGGYRAMHIALADAKINPDKISYINAHGTSTLLGDMLELAAIKRLFGHSISGVSISSTKSSTGHLLGAAGSVEAIFSILTIRDEMLPPTLNLHNPSEGCDVDLVPLIAREKKVEIVLSNSFGFGGTNATLIFKKI